MDEVALQWGRWEGVEIAAAATLHSRVMVTAVIIAVTILCDPPIAANVCVN
jgi:hypothetical protein